MRAEKFITSPLRICLKCLLAAGLVGWFLRIYQKFHGFDRTDYARALLLMCLAIAFMYGVPERLQARIRLFVLWTIMIAGVLIGIWAARLYFSEFLLFGSSLLTWYFLGMFCLDLWVGETLPPFEQTVLSIAIGMILYSFIVLTLGLCGRLFPFDFGMVMAVIILSGLVVFRRHPFTKRNGWNSSSFDFGTLNSNVGTVMLLFLAGLFFVFLISNFVPPTGGDDLAYHLLAPRRFAAAHRIFYMKDVINSNFPFSEEMLYTHGMVWGSLYIYTGMTNVLYAGLLLAAFYLIGRAYFHPASGILAFLFLFSVPQYIVHVCSGAVDLKLLLYSVLAVYAFLKWTHDSKSGWLRLCGILAGCTLNFRYQGILIVGLLSLAVIFRSWRAGHDSVRAIPKILVTFLWPAVIVGFPWYLKNWVETGNPLFYACIKWGGQYYGFLHDSEWSQVWFEYVNPNSAEAFGYQGFGTKWWSFWHLPWNLTFAGGSFEGYRFTPVYLALAPIAFVRSLTRAHRWLLAFCISYTTLWFFQMQELKFLMPAFAVFGLLCADGVLTWKAPRWRTAATIAMLLGCFYVVSASCSPFYNHAMASELIPTAMQKKDKATYIQTHAPQQALIQFANTVLPRNAKIYSICGSALFYLDRNYIAATGPSAPIDYRHCLSTVNFLAKLKDLGVTHVIFPSSPDKSPGRSEYPYSTSCYLLFKNFDFRYFRTLYDYGGQRIAVVNYPVHLRPYDDRESAGPLLVADIILQSGNLEWAIQAYQRAADLGYAVAKGKLNRLQSMSHLERGDYYFGKAKEFDSQRFFLKSALDEYDAVPKGSIAPLVIQERKRAVHAFGMQKAPHIWSHLVTF